jgi:hypothetical protein
LRLDLANHQHTAVTRLLQERFEQLGLLFNAEVLPVSAAPRGLVGATDWLALNVPIAQLADPAH